MNVNTDNPAGRLYKLLREAKKVQTGTGYTTWGEVFGIQGIKIQSPPLDDHVIEVINGVVQLKELITEIEGKLGKIEGINLPLYLTPFARIKEAIKVSHLPINPYSNILNPISEGDLMVLVFCAEELNRHYSEQQVDGDLLTDIFAEVTVLFNEVVNSELPPELKVFILDQLEVIRRGISEYKIRGVERLRETLGELIGAIVIKRDILDASKERPEVGKFGSIVNLLMSAVTFAADSTTLIETVRRLLPG